LPFLNTELSSKRLELLLEMLPNIRRIAVFRDASTPLIWAVTTGEAGRRLGVDLQVLVVAAARRICARRKGDPSGQPQTAGEIGGDAAFDSIEVVRLEKIHRARPLAPRPKPV
jgi:hypothetical protein